MPRRPERLPVLLQLATANAWASQLFDQEMTRQGLAPQQFGLLRIIELHEPITPTDLHFACGIAPATVRLRVHELVESGAVRRVENPDDRRSHFLVTTPEGRRQSAAADAVAAAIETRLGLGPGGDAGPLGPMLDALMDRARTLARDAFVTGAGSTVSGPW